MNYDSQDGLLGTITIRNEHNHAFPSMISLKQLMLADNVRDIFVEYFNKHISPTKDCKLQLTAGGIESGMDPNNAQINILKQTIMHWFNIWKWEKNESKQSVIDIFRNNAVILYVVTLIEFNHENQKGFNYPLKHVQLLPRSFAVIWGSVFQPTEEKTMNTGSLQSQKIKSNENVSSDNFKVLLFIYVQIVH